MCQTLLCFLSKSGIAEAPSQPASLTEEPAINKLGLSKVPITTSFPRAHQGPARFLEREPFCQ